MPRANGCSIVRSPPFAHSHACWLVTYPAAGVLGVAIGLPATFLVMAAGAAAAVVVAGLVWPRHDPEVLLHTHALVEHSHGDGDLAHHGAGTALGDVPGRHRHGPIRHAHAFVIDDHHPAWPRY